MAAIDDVFTPEVVASFAATLDGATPLAKARYEILTAHGPFPAADRPAYWLRHLRAQRAAWEAYIDAAAATGVLDEDVTQRFRGRNDDNIRSAHAECLAAWFFAGKRGYALTPPVSVKAVVAFVVGLRVDPCRELARDSFLISLRVEEDLGCGRPVPRTG